MKPHLHTQGNTLIGPTLLPFTFINKKKKGRNNLFKAGHDVRKKEHKTFKYFQSCFWELYSENTDYNIQRQSPQSKKDLLHFCTWGTSWWQRDKVEIIDCKAVG